MTGMTGCGCEDKMRCDLDERGERGERREAGFFESASHATRWSVLLHGRQLKDQLCQIRHLSLEHLHAPLLKASQTRPTQTGRLSGCIGDTSDNSQIIAMQSPTPTPSGSLAQPLRCPCRGKAPARGAARRCPGRRIPRMLDFGIGDVQYVSPIPSPIRYTTYDTSDASWIRPDSCISDKAQSGCQLLLGSLGFQRVHLVRVDDRSCRPRLDRRRRTRTGCVGPGRVGDSLATTITTVAMSISVRRR